MKFTKQLNPIDDTQPPISKPVPIVPKTRLPDDSDSLANLPAVARRLGVSKRFVQTLVRRRDRPTLRGK